MKEIIFEKSRKNLRKVYDRLKTNSVGRMVGREDVLFLAIGGYNRTYDLLIEMGLDPKDIGTFQNLNLSTKKMAIRKKMSINNINNHHHQIIIRVFRFQCQCFFLFSC